MRGLRRPLRLRDIPHRIAVSQRVRAHARAFTGLLTEHAMTDIAAEVRDILVFHLGAEEVLLTDDARLAEDLGADRLDLVEIAMSCEERFDIDIPNHVATGLATVPALGATV